MGSLYGILAAVVFSSIVASGLYGYHKGELGAEQACALQRQQDVRAVWEAGEADRKALAERAERNQRSRDGLARKLKELDNAIPPEVLAVPSNCMLSSEQLRVLNARATAANEAQGRALDLLQSGVPGAAASPPEPRSGDKATTGLGD